MATEGTAAPMASANNEGSERNERGRGGRGRGRGSGQGRGRARPGAEGENGRPRRGDGRPFRGGGGGGGAGAGIRPQTNDVPPTPAEVPSARATALGKGKAEQDGEAPESDAEVCFICASDVVHHSVAPCNHRTCHICALRMRALYKDKNCAHCRTAAESVIFTDDSTKRYEEYTPADIQRTDNAIGIQYENMEIFGDVVLLLQYNCPDAECDVACISWPDLHNHVKVAHQKMICDLCSRHKKVFTHEHDLYTDKELQQHMRKGDDTPGAVDQTGFKGHPLCSFCGTRFYGNDELYEHCKFKHERCHICEKINGGQPVYFVNTNALQAHHKKEHYPCPEKECVDMKVIVFETLLDLKAHQISEHTDGLKRDARAMDISNFDYRSQYVPERRGGGGQSSRGGGTRGRGRDPNAEPIPASTAQPLRRDELAFQRQMAIHSAQSLTPRTFGGQLSAAPAASASRTPTPQSQTLPPPSRNAENAARQSGLTTATAQPSVQEANLSPQEQARVVRHRAVIERAENLLLHDDSKVNRFRTFISNYKNGSISAKALIDSFFALFSDTSSTALGTLIQEVADLFEDRNKATNIRTAWNDWRAINEDYPSLPGPASMGESTNLPGMGWATITGSGSTQQLSSAPSKAKSSRVLKLKSSTVQSSRSQALQSASWGAPSPPPARSAPSSSVSSAPNAFPSLSSSRASSSKVTTTPWVPTPTSSNPSSARPTPPTSRPASRAQGGDMFPALPPAPKPQSTIFGYGRGMVRRDHGTPVNHGFSWGQNGGASEDQKVEDGEESGGKKKGNKGKKQVLLAWG